MENTITYTFNFRGKSYAISLPCRPGAEEKKLDMFAAELKKRNIPKNKITCCRIHHPKFVCGLIM